MDATSIQPHLATQETRVNRRHCAYRTIAGPNAWRARSECLGAQKTAGPGPVLRSPPMPDAWRLVRIEISASDPLDRRDADCLASTARLDTKGRRCKGRRRGAVRSAMTFSTGPHSVSASRGNVRWPVTSYRVADRQALVCALANRGRPEPGKALHGRSGSTSQPSRYGNPNRPYWWDECARTRSRRDGSESRVQPLADRFDEDACRAWAWLNGVVDLQSRTPTNATDNTFVSAFRRTKRTLATAHECVAVRVRPRESTKSHSWHRTRGPAGAPLKAMSWMSVPFPPSSTSTLSGPIRATCVCPGEYGVSTSSSWMRGRPLPSYASDSSTVSRTCPELAVQRSHAGLQDSPPAVHFRKLDSNPGPSRTSSPARRQCIALKGRC